MSTPSVKKKILDPKHVMILAERWASAAALRAASRGRGWQIQQRRVQKVKEAKKALIAYLKNAPVQSIADDWSGTPEQINALPEKLRNWVMWLETEADPAGTIRENWRLTQENKALRVLTAQMVDEEWHPLTECPENAPSHSMEVLMWSPKHGVRHGHFTKFYKENGGSGFLPVGWFDLDCESFVAWKYLGDGPKNKEDFTHKG